MAEPGGARERASRLLDSGRAALTSGDLVTARADLAASLSAWVALGDQGGAAHASNWLGAVESGLGDLDKARAYILDAVAIWQRQGDAPGQALGRATLALLALTEGQLATAAADAVAAAELARTGVDRRGAARARSLLGHIAMAVGDYSVARAHLDASLVEHAALGTVGSSVADHLALGELAAADGRNDQAGHHIDRASAFCELTGSGRGAVDVATARARLLVVAGRLDDATAAFSAARRDADRLHYIRARLRIDSDLAGVALARGEIAQSLAGYRDAAQGFRACFGPDLEWGGCRVAEALALAEAAHWEPAERAAGEAFDLANQRRAGALRRDAEAALAEIRLRQADTDAHRALVRVRAEALDVVGRRRDALRLWLLLADLWPAAWTGPDLRDRADGGSGLALQLDARSIAARAASADGSLLASLAEEAAAAGLWLVWLRIQRRRVQALAHVGDAPATGALIRATLARAHTFGATSEAQRLDRLARPGS